MSIASEISRLQTAKTDIKAAIEAKGVTVPSSATIDTYNVYVSQISGGISRATSGTPYCTGHDLYVDVTTDISIDGGTSWVESGVTTVLVESGSSHCTRLPAGYTEVEYVQNTGSSTINTNFYPNTNTRVLCEMEMVTTQTYPKLFGAGTWNVNNSLFIEFGNTLSVHWIGSSAVKYSNYPKSFAFAKHKYDLDKGSLYINETLVGTKTYSSVVSVSSPLGIFSYINGSTAGNADEHFLGKLYTFKIYDDGTLVREFIPAKRDSDNIAGLYDIVNDVFYTPMETNIPLVAGDPV